MVAPVFEHITAIMVVSMLFVSAVVAVPAISYVNLLYLDQQQLRIDWGSNFDNIEKFGLALYEGSFYVLDPEKIERLSSSNPSGYLNYENVSTLLGLQNYGFNIRIMPLFKVTVENRSQGNNLLFDVTVTFNDGRPIPNAYVNTTILYVSGEKSDNFNFTTPPGNRTNELGECTISYTLPLDWKVYILVLKVTVADMATITVPYIEGFSQQVANSSIIGDTVTLWIPEGEHPSERDIYNVTLVTAEGVWDYPLELLTEQQRKMTSGVGYQYWIQELTGISYEDPVFLIFNIYTQENTLFSSLPRHYWTFVPGFCS